MQYRKRVEKHNHMDFVKAIKKTNYVNSIGKTIMDKVVVVVCVG